MKARNVWLLLGGVSLGIWSGLANVELAITTKGDLRALLAGKAGPATIRRLTEAAE